jgi:hypothetical protein
MLLPLTAPLLSLVSLLMSPPWFPGLPMELAAAEVMLSQAWPRRVPAPVQSPFVIRVGKRVLAATLLVRLFPRLEVLT